MAGDNWVFDVVAATEAARRELEESGRPIPFDYAYEVPDTPEEEQHILRVEGPDGIAGGLLIREKAGPLPGHHVVRVERLGTTMPQSAIPGALDHLRSMVQSDARVLRCTVNLFTPDEAVRATVETGLDEAGFEPWSEVDGYLHTLVMDLRPPIEEVFAGLHRSARRNIRQIEKKPVELRVIEDPAFAPRMHELAEETYERTGGYYRRLPLEELIEDAREMPNQSRFTGLFLDDAPSEAEALVAYSWGRANGDHGEYSVSASTANLGFRLPLAYPLLWDLIEWAKGWGACWFDLGGVTLGEGEDPFEGISDFKRFFSKEVRTVGGTWVLPPSFLRARLAQSVHPALASIRGALRRRSTV